MLPIETRNEIIGLLKREVVPAMGCTEPVAVSLCTAKAVEILGCVPQHIDVRLSPNVLKNAMGVGIPGTGMVGLPIAVALGALVGRSEYSLEVLKETTPQAVEQGKRMIEEKRINVSLKEGACDVLHIEVEVAAGNERAVAIISGSHTNFIFLQRNDEVLLDNGQTKGTVSDSKATVELTMRKVWEFATESPVEELAFILEARKLNKNVAEESLKGEWGHCLGRTISGNARNKVFGDTVFTRMVSYTSAACDARMGGAQIPVMSNSGSGNQGIASTLPVVVYAEETKASEENLIRALVLSHLTVIYIKQSLGRLSALCGCVVASTGSSCGITFLMGGGYEEMAMAVKNMVANLTGVICDGAKPSCALKLASAVSTALFSSVMAMEHHCVTSLEGIVDDDVDKSIRNLTSIGSQGMQQTDKMILSIMTNK
ncbi:MAG: serine dehydratase subunit alpha family protein [Bacteroidaceae bacterium]|nr:serine dehydratase subunit alpha family protein [Bacteroidaceae bacterium]